MHSNWIVKIADFYALQVVIIVGFFEMSTTNFVHRSQWALAQMAPPSLSEQGGGWGLRSWVYDPPGVCNLPLK